MQIVIIKNTFTKQETFNMVYLRAHTWTTILYYLYKELLFAEKSGKNNCSCLHCSREDANRHPEDTVIKIHATNCVQKENVSPTYWLKSSILNLLLLCRLLIHISGRWRRHIQIHLAVWITSPTD